jgi:hypothetical protein
VLNYQENDEDNNNNNNYNKLHHAVAQEALRLRCVRNVCCGVLLHKKFKSWYGVLCCGFPSNASNFRPQQAASLSYIHRNSVSVCHTPTLKFHGPPPNGRKRQDIEFRSTEARIVCSRHD